MKYIIAIDQGTTSSRAVLFDEQANLLAFEQQEFPQIFPQSAWVEHDPLQIWDSQYAVLERLIHKNQILPADILGIGITNQRETTVVWEKSTSKPIYNAIVWQDKRTSHFCEILKERNLAEYIQNTTGLLIDTYFSATKLHWILENVPQARQQAENGELAFGTIDSWLIWKMTGAKSHLTDDTNASRTMLFDIHNRVWDKKLLDELQIPESLLPKVQTSASFYGNFVFQGVSIPILGVAGDQQAALFGQTCFEAGMAKNTYGTGCFMLMNTGNKPFLSKYGLLTTLACTLKNQVQYALEGSIFVGGAVIQWLRDELKFIKNTADSEKLAWQASPDHGIFVVPAFAGLGTPYWDMYARGAIFGLTRASSRADIARATLESLAFQSKDVLNVMQQDSGISLKSLQVDGGACANNFLMQFQADILNVKVERPQFVETTAIGVAYLAGIQLGIWDKDFLLSKRKIDHIFVPNMSENRRIFLYEYWQEAVKRSMSWLKPNKITT